MGIKKSIGKLIRKISDRFTGNGLMQEENSASGARYVTPGIGELIRKSGADGIVLLKNEGALPHFPSSVPRRRALNMTLKNGEAKASTTNAPQSDIVTISIGMALLLNHLFAGISCGKATAIVL